MLNKGDLMAHLSEEIYNGRMTVEEANAFIGIPPVDSLVKMSEDDVISYYMEYINA